MGCLRPAGARCAVRGGRVEAYPSSIAGAATGL